MDMWLISRLRAFVVFQRTNITNVIKRQGLDA